MSASHGTPRISSARQIRKRDLDLGLPKIEDISYMHLKMQAGKESHKDCTKTNLKID